MYTTAKTITLTLFLAAATACDSQDPTLEPIPEPIVHVHAADAAGIYVNAYLIETENGVVAVDGMLTVSDGAALRASLDSLGKPLLAVLITHGHPDHYNGIGELVRGLDDQGVDIVATQSVSDIIVRDDESKEAQWKPVFGDEWPDTRTFPNRVVAPGETLVFDDVAFTVHNLGPGESHFDSYWTMDTDAPAAFIGDVVFNGVHSYTADGHTAEWLANLAALAPELADIDTVYPGHGGSGGPEILEDQRQYLELYRDTVATLAQGQTTLDEQAKETLTQTMKDHLPTDKLEFLIALGADAVAAELTGQ